MTTDLAKDLARSQGTDFYGADDLLTDDDRAVRDRVRAFVDELLVPAPEPTHALAAAIEEARRCAETGEEKVILTALCGHGHLDLPAYASYLAGTVSDHAWGDADTQAALRASLAALPQVP